MIGEYGLIGTQRLNYLIKLTVERQECISGLGYKLSHIY